MLRFEVWTSGRVLQENQEIKDGFCRFANGWISVSVVFNIFARYSSDQVSEQKKCESILQ